jgi:spore coat polysaccharide biosynthesis protein SpsF
MEVVAVVQARMGSSRLPGKVLADIAGEPMLARVLERIGRAHTVSRVAIATSLLNTDDPIVATAERLGVATTRGNASDVLDRYRQAAHELGADVIVRITADCPLLDSRVLDLVVSSYLAADPRPDYASNVLERTFPRGLDVEVFSRECLEESHRRAVEPHEREHVTQFVLARPGEYRLLSVRNSADLSAMRWTVDTAEDLEFVRAVYKALSPLQDFDWQTVLRLLERAPEIRDINAGVVQRPTFHTAS